LPIQNHIEFIDIFPYRFQMPTPCREYPRLALGCVGLGEFRIKMLDAFAAPGHIAFVVDSGFP
jgi:hypothetical protein